MSKAGIREFKAHLSAYLRRVKRGEIVLLTEHGEVVAEVRPAPESVDDTPASKIARMIERGDLRPPRTPKARPLKNWKGLGARRGEAQRLLDSVRGETPWPPGTSKPAR